MGSPDPDRRISKIVRSLVNGIRDWPTITFDQHDTNSAQAVSAETEIFSLVPAIAKTELYRSLMQSAQRNMNSWLDPTRVEYEVFIK